MRRDVVAAAACRLYLVHAVKYIYEQVEEWLLALLASLALLDLFLVSRAGMIWTHTSAAFRNRLRTYL